MVKEDRTTWKSNYFLKVVKLLDEYTKCFLVNADNVGSKQMQQIRAALREDTVILFGKNTMMRKAIRGHIENNPQLEKLLPCLKGNVGFVFTKGDLNEVRTKLLGHKVAAPAKAGAIAPVDVTIEAQNTGMGPEKTSFFQALNIPTKIARGTVEILNSVHLIHIGEKVGASEASLLNMLKISPFSYGLVIEQVYDSGTVYSPNVLDITQEDVRATFMQGVCNVAAISLEIGIPTVCSAPHSILNGFKDLLAIAVETEYNFPEADQTKEYLKDPSKFASAAPAAAAGGAVEKKVEAKKVESEDESDDDMGFGLFD